MSQDLQNKLNMEEKQTAFVHDDERRNSEHGSKGDVLLQVENLSVSFMTYAGEVKAVRNISFEVDRGETLAFVGESGCGKSVTAKSLMRLLPPDLTEVKAASKIIFDGKDVLAMNARELRDLRGDDIGMIFQDPMTSLNPTMRVGKQIIEGLKLHRGLSGSAAKAEAQRLLELVQIPNAKERLRAYPHEMSGGMRQRVMIAIALSCKPKLLIADEPTTALDVTIQAQILDLIAELKRELNMAVILVTHDLGVVANFTDRIQVMYAGSLAEEGSTDEIFYNARHPYTMALLNAIPKVHEHEGELYTLGGTPPDLLLPLPGCPFAARCDHAMEVCHKLKPQCTHHSATHRNYCWLEHPLANVQDWDALRKGAVK